MVKIIKFLFFAQKVSSGMGHHIPNFYGAIAALEPPPPPKKKWREKGGQRGGSFFSFSIRNEKENGKKYFVHFVGNIYIYIYIFVYI